MWPVLSNRKPARPDRSILITGVAGEIGGFLVEEFLRDSWIVCGLDRKTPTETEKRNFFFQACELSDASNVENKIAQFHDQFGAFDAVINCAGLIANAPLVSFVDGRLAHHDFALWDSVLSSCLSSAFFVTACSVPKMVLSGKKGVVINISSICAHGNPGQAAYSAAKGGLNSLTAALAKELGPLGIRVVALAPGYFDTVSTRDHVVSARLEEIARSVPLRRLGKLEELVAATRFILANRYVNGTIIELDGGLVL
jgi:3-oxoacyl-[acyl-carrier protein] reductase